MDTSIINAIVPGQPGWITGALVVGVMLIVGAIRKWGAQLSWLAWSKTDLGGFGLMVLWSYLGVLCAHIGTGKPLTWAIAWTGLQQTATVALAWMAGKKTKVLKASTAKPPGLPAEDLE